MCSLLSSGLLVDVVLLDGGRRSDRSDGVVDVVEHLPSAMLWLLLLRWCAHESLLSQSRWRSWLQGHLIVVVVAIGLGRLQLGCHVVVVVDLRSQFWFLTKQ